MNASSARETHLEAARARLHARAEAARKRHLDLETRARLDATSILEHIVARYAPIRVYQWGSLLRDGAFREYSDIDIAVEGILAPDRFFRLLGEV